MSTADVMTASQKLTSQQLRKIKKPLIEKRRRERINESLNQLKSLVLDAMEKDESQYNKMEKADILEMTVKHLKNLQSQLSTTNDVLATDQTSPYKLITCKHNEGFQQCASEVHRYLKTVPTCHPGVKDHVNTSASICPDPVSLSNQESGVHRNCDNLDDYALKATSPEQSMSLGVQIGIPVVSGSSKSVVLASQLTSMYTPQGYVPVLISPGCSNDLSSGISVASSPKHQPSPTSTQGRVIPLYADSNHDNSRRRSQSLESAANRYQNLETSPPSSPVPHFSGSPNIAQIEQQHLCNRLSSHGNDKSVQMTQQHDLHNTHSPHRNNHHLLMTQSRAEILVKGSFGYDLYKHNSEMLGQSSGSSNVWRPW